MQSEKETNMSNLISEKSCVFRGTDKQKGRTRAVAPGVTPMKYLSYGRIVLDAGDKPVSFNTAECETGFICLKGKAAVQVGGSTYQLTQYDGLYMPPGSGVVVTPSSEGCDLAEMGSPVQGSYPVQFISFAEIQKDPTLHFTATQVPSERVVNVVIGENVKGGRLLAGVTFIKPGNWASWPPHEHTEMLEEAYLYIDMPRGSFGIQMVYTNVDAPELVTFVKEGDIVLMPGGYHPNVSCPSGKVGFLWMMAAHREDVDRHFGVVTVQPEYAGSGSGLKTRK
jgi:5-deoxy-glucuronate isomerase